MRNLRLAQLLVPDVLRLGSLYIRAPHVLEEDALLCREIECKISSSARANDTDIVVQGHSNDIMRHLFTRPKDLESEPWLLAQNSNALFREFDIDLRYCRFEQLDFLLRGKNCGRIKATLFGCQLVEPLKELDHEAVVLQTVDPLGDHHTFSVPTNKAGKVSANDQAEGKNPVLVGQLICCVQEALSEGIFAVL